MTDKQYLVLSKIAYANFSVDGENSDINSTIGDLLLRYPIIKNEILKEEDGWTKDITDSVKDFTLINFENNDGLTGSGFGGCAFKSPTGETVFAFRGTEWVPSITDPLGDFLGEDVVHIGLEGVVSPLFKDGSILMKISQFEDAKQFVTNTLMPDGPIISPGENALDLAVQNNKVTYTGHSLGGGLASYLAYLTNGASNSKAVTFNAVGVGQLLPPESSLEEYRVTDYCDALDLVGNLGRQIGTTKFTMNVNNLDDGYFSPNLNMSNPINYLQELWNYTGKKVDLLYHRVI